MIHEVRSLSELAFILAARKMPEETAKESADVAVAAAEEAKAAAEVAQRPYISINGIMVL